MRNERERPARRKESGAPFIFRFRRDRAHVCELLRGAGFMVEDELDQDTTDHGPSSGSGRLPGSFFRK
jgi:hypothetical protein